MLINTVAYHQIKETLTNHNATLVAVSKTKPVEAIKALYDLGQRDFGENYVQELTEKQSQLPNDVRWHFIGHLQTNKVKYIAPFVALIHGVDSYKLLKEINKQAQKQSRIIPVLLQIHIAKEETKFGLDEQELAAILNDPQLAALEHICIKGLMGMASFSDDKDLVKNEFASLKALYDQYKEIRLGNCQFEVLSMGMSADYMLAIGEGSTMVRIGSLLFGSRA
jgi:pyridoxal phosphate enzyme (YggS family)